MHLSCKNVNSNSVKTIFTGYIESLTLEKLCNRKALEEKSTQVGGQRCDQIKAAPGGSLVNCIATSDFKIKTMALLCDSQQPATLLKKKKKKNGDAFFKLWLTTRGDGSRILATLGLFLPLSLKGLSYT